MKFEELKQNIKSKIEPIYLLEGEEAFFRSRAIDIIKNAGLEEPSLNFAKYQGTEIKTQPDILVSALLVYPFMGQKRVIEVDEWYPTGQDLKNKSLKSYFDDPCETSVLVIVNEKKCEALKKLSCVTVVDCGKASIELAVKFIRQKALNSNLIVSTSVCKLICEYCLLDLVKINSEVDKLIDYSLGESEITEEAVNLMVVKDTSYKTFEIVNFISQKNYTNAYKILSEMKTVNEKTLLLASLYSHFRLMFYTKTSKLITAEIANNLSISEFIVKKAGEQARSFSAKMIRTVMDKLAENDSGFKSGRLTLDNAFTDSVMTILTSE